MSVDFYVAMSAANWPTAAAVQQCMVAHAYPVQISRFPILNGNHVVTDGVNAAIDGKDAYLEGELATASAMPTDTKVINDRLSASGSSEKIKADDVLMSVRVRSPTEVRAASYVLSSLIVCFNGFGFEPQGNTSGRADFARSLISGAEATKGQLTRRPFPIPNAGKSTTRTGAIAAVGSADAILPEGHTEVTLGEGHGRRVLCQWHPVLDGLG